MRASSRFLATVRSGRYLTPGNPTGLAGLQTHPAPRSTLIYLYSSTLSVLNQFPDSSAYRTSTEALTKHRLSIVEATKPPGYDEWLVKSKKVVADNPELFGIEPGKPGSVERVIEGKKFLRVMLGENSDAGEGREWEGEEILTQSEGPSAEGGGRELTQGKSKGPDSENQKVEWVMEPALETEQVEDIENKIGAGLIEEVIQVAEGELKAAKVLLKNTVWEELEEKPSPTQWEYFQRDRSTPKTQEQPKV